MPSAVQILFFFSSRRRHTRWPRDWSSDVCSSDLSYQYSRILKVSIHVLRDLNFLTTFSMRQWTLQRHSQLVYIDLLQVEFSFFLILSTIRAPVCPYLNLLYGILFLYAFNIM